MVSTKAQEDLANVEASIEDLVPKGGEKKFVMKKTWEFGPSLVTEEMIGELAVQGCFPEGKGWPSGGETVPHPELNEAVIFKDFFACGLHFPSVTFLRLVLGSFKVQLHHLTLNKILMLSKFCWVCESYGLEPELDTFCAYYELQRQPKKATIGKIVLVAQFGSCTFMVKRSQKEERLEISFAQRNKWDKDWTCYWFYVKTSGVNTRDKRGNKAVRYLLASTMDDMRPSTSLMADSDAAREACDVAFPQPAAISEAGILWRKWWPLDSGR